MAATTRVLEDLSIDEHAPSITQNVKKISMTAIMLADGLSMNERTLSTRENVEKAMMDAATKQTSGHTVDERTSSKPSSNS